MKLFILNIFLLLGHYGFTQKTDNIVAKVNDETIKAQLNNARYIAKKKEFDNYLLNNLYKIDTVSKKKDSIVISYFTKNNTLIRTVKIGLINYNLLKDSLIKFDSSIAFYNSKGLVEYYENWHFTVTAYDQPEMGIVSHVDTGEPYLSYCCRSGYDEFGQEVFVVFLMRGTFSRVKRYYDANGKLINYVSEDIKYYQFWD